MENDGIQVNSAPLQLIQMEEIVVDELGKNFTSPFDMRAIDIYNNTPCNTVMELINEFGERYVLRAAFAGIIYELHYKDTVDLEAQFRKTARIWLEIMKSGLTSQIGSLGGIVCLPLALHDKGNDIPVDEDLKPLYFKFSPGIRVPNIAVEVKDKLDDSVHLGRELPTIKEENVVRRFLFHFIVYPYHVRGTDCKPNKTYHSARELNERSPYPVFIEEGEIPQFTFSQYDDYVSKVTDEHLNQIDIEAKNVNGL